MLASMLRHSRMTLLTGVAGAGKTCLLREGVLPHLSRRSDDPPGPLPVDERPQALEAAESSQDRSSDEPAASSQQGHGEVRKERRHLACSGAEPGVREVAVFMDAWAEDQPLSELRRRLFHAFGRSLPPSLRTLTPTPGLAEEIAALCREQDARVLVVLDAFEGLLNRPATDAAAADFAGEWVRVVNQPGLPVHFLVAVRQEAQALLARFHHVLPALASNWVGLLPVPAVPSPRPPLEPDRPCVPEPAPLGGVASGPNQPPPPTGGSGVAASDGVRADDPGPVQPPAREAPEALRPRTRRAPMSLALVALLVGGLAWWWPAGLTPPPPVPVAAKPSVPVPDAAASIRPEPGVLAGAVPVIEQPDEPLSPAVWSIQTGPGQRTDAQVAEELQRSLEARLPPGDWPALQILHYDALEAARSLPGPPWRVIGPLFPEELQLIVRADAPFRYIHQIRGRQIGTTPSPDGGVSGTAALLHQRLFGQLPAEGQVQAAPWPQALSDLQAGRTDVLLLADGEPSAWLSELSAQERRSLRLLALDPAAPQTRLVQQSFLPVRMLVPEGLGGGSGPQSPAGRTLLTLAVMSFLTTTAPPEADAAVLGLVRAWCQAMPELRRNGHPKWRAAQPWLPLGVGGPPIPGVREALNRCAPTRPARE